MASDRFVTAAGPGEADYQDDLALRISGDSTVRAFAFSLLILAFNIWDRFIDAAHADQALPWRIGTAVAILVVHGVWVVAKKKTYALFRRLVLIHTVTVPVGLTGAVAQLDDGLVYGLWNFIFIYLWIPSVLPGRRDAMLGGILAAISILTVMLLTGHGGFALANVMVLSVLGILLSMTTATKFEAALRRAWQQEQVAAREARTDSLTGLVNRRRFTEAAAAEWGRSIRYGRPSSLILFDLDHFKQVNDEHGHAAGDLVLKQVAEVCQFEIRDFDLLARIGGEEFAVLLPETSAAAAVGLAERLRRCIERLEVKAMTGILRPTASFGVAPLALEGHDWTEALHLADGALYRAKENGRNRVETAGIPH